MTKPIVPIMTSLLVCLRDNLAGSVGGPVSWLSLVPARTVPQDYCSEGCSMGFVRLDSMFPSKAFPLADQTATKCDGPWAARLEVGVFRCLPVEAPSVEESTTATVTQIDDAERIRAAIACCDAYRNYLVNTYVPAGPNGGCGGGSWFVTVQVM